MPCSRYIYIGILIREIHGSVWSMIFSPPYLCYSCKVYFLQGPQSLFLICLFKYWASSITIYPKPTLFFYFWLRNYFMIHSPSTCLVVWVGNVGRYVSATSCRLRPVTHSFSSADEWAKSITESRREGRGP